MARPGFFLFPAGTPAKVRLWHLADVPLTLTNVCLEAKNGHDAGVRLRNVEVRPLGRWFESGPGSQTFQGFYAPRADLRVSRVTAGIQDFIAPLLGRKIS